MESPIIDYGIELYKSEAHSYDFVKHFDMLKSFAVLVVVVNVCNAGLFTALTNFDITANLRCSILQPGDRWTFELTFWERDRGFDDDRISNTYAANVEKETISFLGKAIDDGEGYLQNFFNARYEVYAYIQHNCTETGNVKVVSYDVSNANVKSKYVKETFDLTLDNMGKQSKFTEKLNRVLKPQVVNKVIEFTP
ncbi:unnamed protein product [Caenorhabditis bovis]|uniref:Uncharacterized protein n=1 Tax=Caenorhabditis bovis TaxID=2654633 RepID=A0A8S1F8F7_9PELO|nr:unnamed protein product [Caenorhabditis bovis]